MDKKNFIVPLTGLKKEIIHVYTKKIKNKLHIGKNNYLCGPKRECGQIWLLATTLKNAKILTPLRIS